VPSAKLPSVAPDAERHHRKHNLLVRLRVGLHTRRLHSFLQRN